MAVTAMIAIHSHKPNFSQWQQTLIPPQIQFLVVAIVRRSVIQYLVELIYYILLSVALDSVRTFFYWPTVRIFLYLQLYAVYSLAVWLEFFLSLWKRLLS